MKKETFADVSAELKRHGFPGWRNMTAAQRRNEQMHRMFELARRTQGDDYGKGFGGTDSASKQATNAR